MSGSRQKGRGLDIFIFQILHSISDAFPTFWVTTQSMGFYVTSQKASGDGFWVALEKQCSVFPNQASLDLGLFWCGLLSMLFMVRAYTFWSLTSFK